MTQPPANPKIYHIVNVDRLASIVGQAGLWSDAEMIKRQLPGTMIGMGSIKERRLHLPVSCHNGVKVGECVPFYYCPRSVMLYVIHRASSPELTYKGGQGPIIHLEADLNSAIAWATQNGRIFAFSDANAGAYYAQFWSDPQQLSNLNWTHIGSRQWSEADVKEAKQAEFLMFEHFPWHLIERIGVLSTAVANQVSNAMNNVMHRPPIQIMPAWYY